MNLKAAWIASTVVVVGALAASFNSGCGDDDPTAAVPSRLARKGEACQTTNDCAASLACMPSGSPSGGGVCVVGVFNVTQTGRECAITECQQASDCCDTPPAGCESLKQSCDAFQAGRGGSPAACEQYEALCVCDASSRDCESGRCVVKCTSDSSCAAGGNGSKCLGGKCAECASDGDCGGSGSDLSCISGKCQPPCQGDGDCPGFERCLQNKCVEGGCQTTRECIAATRNVEATCGTDGKCIVPCQTDLECGNPKGYSFYSCVGGQCLYMGCESDKDCRLLLGDSSGTSGGLTSKQHVVCRDKQTPNATTRPAQ